MILALKKNCYRHMDVGGWSFTVFLKFFKVFVILGREVENKLSPYNADYPCYIYYEFLVVRIKLYYIGFFYIEKYF